VEPIVFSVNDSVPDMVHSDNDTGGFMQIDFSNAYNTISRKVLAEAVCSETPSLRGIFRFFYNTPSALLVQVDGKMSCMLSVEGGRQGDPLMPFFFSLAIKPLVKFFFFFLQPVGREFCLLCHLRLLTKMALRTLGDSSGHTSTTSTCHSSKVFPRKTSLISSCQLTFARNTT